MRPAFKWLIGVLLVAAVVVAGTLLYLDHRLDEGVRDARALFDATEASLEARRWERSESPHDPVVEGSAARAYLEAFATACPLDAESVSHASNPFSEAALAIATPLAERTSPSAGRAADGPGDRCAAAGVQRIDAVTAPLDEAACDRLSACASALDRVAEGTRRLDARSPVAVFGHPGSDTAVADSFVWLDLANMTLTRGYLRSIDAGAPEPLVEAALTNIRLGRDLCRGAPLLPCAAGAAVQRPAMDVLRHLLAEPLAPALGRRIAVGLDAVLASPVDREAMVEAELLLSLGALLHAVGEDLSLPPGAVRVQVSDELSGAAFREAIATQATWWREMLDAQSTDALEDRTATYATAEHRFAGELNPISAVLPNIEPADRAVSVTDAQLRLLLAAYALTFVPERVASLPVDPLTGEVFVVDRGVIGTAADLDALDIPAGQRAGLRIELPNIDAQR